MEKMGKEEGSKEKNIFLVINFVSPHSESERRIAYRLPAKTIFPQLLQLFLGLASRCANTTSYV